jgi:hypothetical protein
MMRGAAEPAPLHGYELTRDEQALLRSPPPIPVIDWCEEAAGARVTAVRALDGGTSSAVHALDLADGRALVLRRFVRREWLADEPDVPPARPPRWSSCARARRPRPSSSPSTRPAPPPAATRRC